MVETTNCNSEEKVVEKTVEPKHHIDAEFEKATFGMGCFWGCDSLFGSTKGILRTKVGYSGGSAPKPVYRNLGDHTEVIELHYDPTKITYDELLEIFWNNHEYGLTKRIKRQYMSLILYHTPEQKEIAQKSLRLEQDKRSPDQIITEIAPANEFYPAEDYHQKYRLQGHKNLMKELKITKDLLQTSHVAARLNGYLVGVGGVQQFLEEAEALGLTKEQVNYVKRYIEDNEGGGVFC
uniref:peptide-methionine (S)-S-oxide reductase n=1 Tax=Corethrella appendiculata TaxID=1370023 RepID=U5ESG1_9DIPT